MWDRLTQQARTLHARNSHVILGPKLDDPVGMVLCWTPDGPLEGTGADCGGTGQALRVAAGEAPGCRVFNLARREHFERIWTFTGRQPIRGSLFAAQSATSS